ncbi:MAG: hypothetical protein WC634_03350 [archaeon]
MNIFRKIGSFFPRKKIYRGGAGKNVLVARKVKKRQKMTIDINDESGYARGLHGQAFDLRILKGKHEARLVIKKYHLGNQTRKAEREFELFQQLKRLGLAVPPTIRLVEINGKKYVALTDLSKFGQIQTKDEEDVYLLLGKERGNEMKSYTKSQNERAAEAGIVLRDCWEYVIDPQQKTARAFILDLEHCRNLRSA